MRSSPTPHRTDFPNRPPSMGQLLGECRVDDQGYVWEHNGWTGDWEPVRDAWGSHVRKGGSTWWGSEDRKECEEGGCFVTTACVESRGLPNDCPELSCMRKFRDGYVAELPNGRELIEAYYTLAPRIVEAIDLSPERQEIYNELYERWLSSSLRLIAAGKHEKAFDNCVIVLCELSNEYLSVSRGH